MRRLRDFGLLIPTAALALAAMSVFVLSLVIWSRGIDDSTLQREQALVSEGLRQVVTEVERSILPEAVWDEAVQHLDHRRDLVWADQNLNDFYALGFEFSRLIAIDHQDQPFYHRVGRESAPSADADLEPFQQLIASVRRAERERRPTRAARDRGIQSSTFVMHQGDVALATATLVQPEGGSMVLSGARAPILLTLLPIEQVAIEVLQERYLLRDMRSGLGDGHVLPGDAVVNFHTLSPDAPALTLAWRPRTPGRALLISSILPIGAVLLAFGAVAAVMVVRGRNAWRQQLAAQRTQTEFLANMTHEVRTPLNGVCAIAEALERTSLSREQQEMVQIIRSSGASLERLLSDLLDVSREESGKVRVTQEAFDLAEAARTVITLLAPRAAAKGLALNLVIDPAAEATVAGDPVRLKQILANLVGNAIKFTEIGQVDVAVTATAEGRWRFSVADTGIGFDGRRKAALFQRFVQADASISRRYGGTGLGLAICRQLAERMGGEIDAESSPGDGARFWVDLPLPLVGPAEKAAAGADTESTCEPGERRLRILAADDHPINRQVLEVVLSQFDAELVLAENGEEACEAFETAFFDVVLMDMQMPVMDGLTAIRTIRAKERESAREPTPIIMLSANTLPEHQAASFAAGADLHLPKPLDAQRLLTALQTMGERQAAA